MTKRIEVRIKNGKTIIETSGFTDDDCLKEIEKLKAKIPGLEAEQVEMKSDSYVENTETEDVLY